jgi:Putative transposase
VAWLVRNRSFRIGVPRGPLPRTSRADSHRGLSLVRLATRAVRALRDGPMPSTKPTTASGRHPPTRRPSTSGSTCTPVSLWLLTTTLGAKRLIRYGARPPLALDRLRRLPGGRIVYRVKKFRDWRAKHREMSPLHFLRGRRRSSLRGAIPCFGTTECRGLGQSGAGTSSPSPTGHLPARAARLHRLAPETPKQKASELSTGAGDSSDRCSPSPRRSCRRVVGSATVGTIATERGPGGGAPSNRWP